MAYRVRLKTSVKPNTARGWLAKGKAIGSATTANAAMFTSIVSFIQPVADDTEALDELQAAAANKGRDEVAARDAGLTVLKRSIRAFIGALQALCDKAPDVASAEALAAAASIDVKKEAIPHKPDFQVKVLGNGAVHMVAKVPVKKGSRIFFEWQMSSDGGQTWVTVAITNDADVLVQNLTPDVRVKFRFRWTFKNTVSTWSRTIEKLVQ